MRSLIKKLIVQPMNKPEDIVRNAQCVLEDIKQTKMEKTVIKVEPISKDDPNIRKILGKHF